VITSDALRRETPAAVGCDWPVRSCNREDVDDIVSVVLGHNRIGAQRWRSSLIFTCKAPIVDVLIYRSCSNTHLESDVRATFIHACSCAIRHVQGMYDHRAHGCSGTTPRSPRTVMQSLKALERLRSIFNFIAPLMTGSVSGVPEHPSAAHHAVLILSNPSNLSWRSSLANDCVTSTTWLADASDRPWSAIHHCSVAVLSRCEVIPSIAHTEDGIQLDAMSDLARDARTSRINKPRWGSIGVEFSS
jgi:hypothetical protein